MSAVLHFLRNIWREIWCKHTNATLTNGVWHCPHCNDSWEDGE